MHRAVDAGTHVVRGKRRPGGERGARRDDEQEQDEAKDLHRAAPVRKQRPGPATRPQIEFLQVKGLLLRCFFVATAAALVLVRHRLSYDVAAACPRSEVRERRQPGHAGLRQRPDRPREPRPLRRGRHPARHPRRPQHLDEEDLQGRARVEGAGDRLRLAAGLAGRLRRRLDRPGRRHPRDGAADEHRLVDADRRRRREHPVRPAAQGRSTTRPHRSASSRRPTTGTRTGPRAVRQASNLGATEALEKNVIDVMAPTLPDAPEQDRRDEDGAEGHRPAHGGRGDHERRHVPLAEDPRHADRPEPDRALHVDRDARHHRRALEPGPDLPGHGRRDLPHPRPLRPPGAADQRGRPAADAARLRLLRRRGVRPDPRRDHPRGGSLLRDRRAAALRARRRHVPGLAARGDRDRRDDRGPDGARRDQDRPGAASAGRDRDERARRPGRRRP